MCQSGATCHPPPPTTTTEGQDESNIVFMKWCLSLFINCSNWVHHVVLEQIWSKINVMGINIR